MGRKKSARFEKDEEEATPAENDEMIEAENNYGVTFRNYTDFCKWKEVQGQYSLLPDKRYYQVLN